MRLHTCRLLGLKTLQEARGKGSSLTDSGTVGTIDARGRLGVSLVSCSPFEMPLCEFSPGRRVKN